MEKYKARSRWVKMLSRCEDDDNPQWKDYGGRGIYVASEWRDFSSFYEWILENGVSSELQLDRVDNDGPYSPENCKFVSRSKNARNKRNNKILTAFQESKTMMDWSEDPRCVVEYRTLLNRVLRGWEHGKALTELPDATRSNKTPHNASLLTALGETKSISQWLKDERCHVKNHQLVWSRMNRGWTAESALTTPPRPMKR